MSSITCLLQDEDGNGLPNQDVKLRRLGASNFGVDVYTMSDVSGEPGSYEYSGGHVTDTYKVWVNGSEDKSFGGNSGVDIIRLQDVLLKSGGTMTGNILMGNNRIKELPDPVDNDEPETKGRVATFISNLTSEIGTAITTLLGNSNSWSGTQTFDIVQMTQMDSDIAMAENRITGLSAPVTGTGAARKAEFDTLVSSLAKYLDKSPGLSVQQIFSDVFFRSRVFSLLEPTSLTEVCNAGYVERYVNQFLNAVDPMANQQSYNYIRVVPSGAGQEDNRLYRTLSAGITQAESFASASRIMVVIYEGNGAGDQLANWNLLPNTIDEYVHIEASDPGSIFRIGEIILTFATLWKNIIKGGIIDNEGIDAETTIVRGVFIGVEFTNSYVGSHTPYFHFQDCVLINCKKRNVNFTFDANCDGQYYDIVNKKTYFITGFNLLTYDVLSNSGDVKPRRLLGRNGGVVASAETITLGNGNIFSVSGTTQIKWIDLEDVWTPGSEITLEFTDVLTLKHVQIPDPGDAGFFMLTGADVNTFNGDRRYFQLDTNGDFWIEKPNS